MYYIILFIFNSNSSNSNSSNSSNSPQTSSKSHQIHPVSTGLRRCTDRTVTSPEFTPRSKMVVCTTSTLLSVPVNHQKRSDGSGTSDYLYHYYREVDGKYGEPTITIKKHHTNYCNLQSVHPQSFVNVKQTNSSIYQIHGIHKYLYMKLIISCHAIGDECVFTATLYEDLHG